MVWGVCSPVEGGGVGVLGLLGDCGERDVSTRVHVACTRYLWRGTVPRDGSGRGSVVNPLRRPVLSLCNQNVEC